MPSQSTPHSLTTRRSARKSIAAEDAEGMEVDRERGPVPFGNNGEPSSSVEQPAPRSAIGESAPLPIHEPEPAPVEASAPEPARLPGTDSMEQD